MYRLIAIRALKAAVPLLNATGAAGLAGAVGLEEDGVFEGDLVSECSTD
jgi:hypothetical protein